MQPFRPPPTLGKDTLDALIFMSIIVPLLAVALYLGLT